MLSFIMSIFLYLCSLNWHVVIFLWIYMHCLIEKTKNPKSCRSIQLKNELRKWNKKSSCLFILQYVVQYLWICLIHVQHYNIEYYLITIIIEKKLIRCWNMEFIHNLIIIDWHNYLHTLMLYLNHLITRIG